MAYRKPKRKHTWMRKQAYEHTIAWGFCLT